MRWIMNADKSMVAKNLELIQDKGIEIGDPLSIGRYSDMTYEELKEIDLVGLYKPMKEEEREIMRKCGIIYPPTRQNEVYFIEEEE